MTPDATLRLTPVSAPRARVITPPDVASGVILAELCADPDIRAQVQQLIGSVVHLLAECDICFEVTGLTEPFTDPVERDVWAARHVTNTGHAVRLTLTHSGMQDPAGLHLTGAVSRTAWMQFEFVCAADGCGRVNGPYDIAAAAVASWRQHRPVTA
jgi:hypothetical protein